jgi:hypothetical protein
MAPTKKCVHIVGSLSWLECRMKLDLCAGAEYPMSTNKENMAIDKEHGKVLLAKVRKPSKE